MSGPELEKLRLALTDAIVARPFTAVAAAALAGFALGGGLSRNALLLLIESGARFVAASSPQGRTS